MALMPIATNQIRCGDGAAHRVKAVTVTVWLDEVRQDRTGFAGLGVAV